MKRVLASVAATTVAVVLVGAYPAQANVRHFKDARDDTASTVNIWSVTVDNSTAFRNKVVVSVQQDDVRQGDFISIYFDTDPSDPGPEYRLTGVTDSEYGMSRVERWNADGNPVPADCDYRLRIHRVSDRTRAVVSRSCLGNPGKIAVAVKVQRGFPPTSRDWAKDFRTWLHPVAR